MPRSIVYYNGRLTATDAVQRSLVHLFADSQNPVDCADRDRLLNDRWLDASQTALVILPGIIGEDSPYPQDLNASFMQALKRFVHEGGNVLAFCAGAAHLSRNVVYTTPWGTNKQRDNTHYIFNGTANGPLRDYATPYNNDNHFSDIALTPVFARSTKNGQHIIPIPYGNGPAFYPAPGEPVEIYARYSQLPGHPAAVIGRRHGAGQVILSGIHPEITRDNMHNVNQYLNDARLQAVIDRLTPEQDARRDNFLHALMNTLLPRHNKGGNVGDKLLHLSL